MLHKSQLGTLKSHYKLDTNLAPSKITKKEIIEKSSHLAQQNNPKPNQVHCLSLLFSDGEEAINLTPCKFLR